MKFVLGALVFFASIPALAQEKFTQYYSSYQNDTFDIQLSNAKPGKFELFIEAHSLAQAGPKGGFVLNNKTYQGFVDNLTAAKAKYVEWSATAKHNKVAELRKPIEVKPKPVGGAFQAESSLVFDNTISPAYAFQVDGQNGVTRYVLLVNSGEMTAAGNKSVKAGPYILAFSTTEEIDTFLSAIKWEKIMAHINKPKADELFR